MNVYKVIQEFTIPASTDGVVPERVVAVGEELELDAETAEVLVAEKVVELVEQPTPPTPPAEPKIEEPKTDEVDVAFVGATEIEVLDAKGKSIKKFTPKDGPDFVKQAKELANSRNCSISIK